MTDSIFLQYLVSLTNPQTLVPLASFASELGTSFPVKLEAPHVISSKQVSVPFVVSWSRERTCFEVIIYLLLGRCWLELFPKKGTWSWIAHIETLKVSWCRMLWVVPFYGFAPLFLRWAWLAVLVAMGFAECLFFIVVRLYQYFSGDLVFHAQLCFPWAPGS